MKGGSLFLAAILSVLFLGATAGPLSAGKIPVISAEELKTKLDAGETVFLLNPLADIVYNEGFIPGSVNIPMHELQNTDKLPADKGVLIVSYCLGPK